MTEPVRIGDATLYLGGLSTSLRMNSGVFGTCRQFKILDSVVGFVAVQVVDKFVRRQFTAKVGLHNNTMLASPSVRTVNFRCERDVTVRIVRLSTPIMAMIRPMPAHGLALKASTAFRDALSERPFGNWFFKATIASTIPIVKALPFFSIRNRNKASKPLTSQVRNLVYAAVL